MTTSEMTDRELDKAIAEAMGFHHDVVRADGYKPDAALYARSVDQLGVVEHRLRATGWILTLTSPSDGHGWFAEWRCWPNGIDNERVMVRTIAATEARARAEVALQALIAIEPTSITTLASRGKRCRRRTFLTD